MDRNLTSEALPASKQPIVRFATLADLTQIAHVARVTWDDTYNETIAPENRRQFLERAYQPANLADAINATGHWFYVAELAGEVIGFGHFLQRYHPSRSRAELVRLYVLPNYQRQKIGASILQTGFADLAEAGIEQCFVSVQASNISAQKFYEQHGFSYHRRHGQFLGTQIVTLVEYVRPISRSEAKQ
jgi:ribosomal protein S18 acetylase RimI-like enzyme